MLKNKVVIITGAGRGIGATMAAEFARQGASHLVINDLDEKGARSVADETEKTGAKTLVSTQDVSNHAAAAALVEDVLQKFGRVDVLVNNAGITRDAMLHKMTEAQWDEVIRVNLKGVFNMGQACAKAMISKKAGCILNISSVAWLGNVGQTNYSASKAGVIGMTHTWAIELARHGIRCNAIAPGLIDSVLTRQVPPEIREKFIEKIPLHRIGDTLDIAHTAAFLCSDAAGYVTGQVLHVDGGLSVGI